MNATKTVRQTNGPLETKNNRLRSIETSLVASQVPGPGKEKAGRKSASGGNQHRKTSPRSEQLTVIEARIDVGFGNSLFIRGRGAELSWDKGVPLTCTGSSTWVWSTAHAKDKVVFKLLLNDQIWAKGEDTVVEAGKKLVFEPAF